MPAFYAKREVATTEAPKALEEMAPQGAERDKDAKKSEAVTFGALWMTVELEDDFRFNYGQFQSDLFRDFDLLGPIKRCTHCFHRFFFLPPAVSFRGDTANSVPGLRIGDKMSGANDL